MPRIMFLLVYSGIAFGPKFAKTEVDGPPVVADCLVWTGDPLSLKEPVFYRAFSSSSLPALLDTKAGRVIFCRDPSMFY